MKIVLTGESHLGPLVRGAKTDSDKFSSVVFEPLGPGGQVVSEFFKVDETGLSVSTHAEGWQERTFSAQRLKDDYGTALLVVSMPLNTSRVLRNYSWHKHVPWQLKKEPKEIALSDAVVRTIFEEDCLQAIGFCKALKSAGIETAVVEAPRFFGHAPFLRKQRKEVCQYVDSAYRDYVRGALEAFGIGVISQPEQTVGEPGMTHSDYAHQNPEDTHHGNAAYGALALEAVLDYAEAL